MWNFSLLWKHKGYILLGTVYTLIITFGALVIGVILGVLLGIGRLSKNRVANAVSSAYVTVIRGTPMLLQIFFVFFGVPQLFYTITGTPLNLDPVVTGIIALGINSAAYVAEIVRGGIQSIDKGQMEAARSLGLNYQQAMRHVILPQAFRNIIPALGNEFIVMLKDSFAGFFRRCHRTDVSLAHDGFPLLCLHSISYGCRRRLPGNDHDLYASDGSVGKEVGGQ